MLVRLLTLSQVEHRRQQEVLMCSVVLAAETSVLFVESCPQGMHALQSVGYSISWFSTALDAWVLEFWALFCCSYPMAVLCSHKFSVGTEESLMPV
jgi:hypothetical protein